jgi:hypothetical protein
MIASVMPICHHAMSPAAMRSGTPAVLPWDEAASSSRRTAFRALRIR